MAADYWQAQERQLQAQQSARQVVFVCPYCTKEIDEHAACCGEIGRAVPMTEGDDE